MAAGALDPDTGGLDLPCAQGVGRHLEVVASRFGVAGNTPKRQGEQHEGDDEEEADSEHEQDETTPATSRLRAVSRHRETLPARAG